MSHPRSRRKKRRDHERPDEIEKVVRDSFSMPKAEHQQIATLKGRTLGRGVAVKKSELLRAGLALLAGLNDDDLLSALSRLRRVKTGRPRGEKR